MEDVHYGIILVSFGLYTLAIIAVGLYSMRYSKQSSDDYFLASRGLGPWIAAFSASASSESGWVTLGLVGWAFTEGVRAYWIIPGCLLGFAFNWFVLAQPLREQSEALGALTLPDYFAFRFKEKKPILRLTSVLVILTAMGLYVAAQFAAAGKAFATVFPGVDYTVGVVLGAFIVLIYTITGGFRAVCWTDFFQALLMLTALVVFPIILILNAGGFGELLAGLPSDLFTITPRKSGIAFIGFLFGSGALGINFGYPGQPHVVIRFMALKSKADAVKGGIISIVWGFCVYWGAVTIGLIARAAAERGADWAKVMLDKPDIYGELGLVLSAMHLLPGVIAGLILAAVLAAICSTADSQLVVAASSMASDIGDRLLHRQKGGKLLLDRGMVLILGIIAVLLVLNQEIRVYKFVLTYGWALLGAAFGPQLILALFWKRASYAGSIAGMITAFVIVFAWQSLYHPGPGGVEIYNLPLAFIVSMLVNIMVSLFSSPSEVDIA